MSRILVAEDSLAQATEISIRLEAAGYEVALASNGREALELIEQQPCDLVLTDLHMPEMNGLEVVEAIRARFPDVPVILMTGDGTEQIAFQALRKGASSYIPKELMESDLIPTVNDVVKMLRSRHQQKQVAGILVKSASTFRFGNDHEMAMSLVAHIESELLRIHNDDRTGIFRIVLALKEAVINAIDHGNLELDSSLRDSDDCRYRELGRQRSQQDPWQHRKVTLTARISPDQVQFVIRDEGPGFDPSSLPDPRDPENLMRAHGRGLMLIRSFMDEVSHNETGNEVTMTQRLRATDSTHSASA